jgi:hypothetical protein
MGGLTPYALLGDVPIIYFIALLLLALLLHSHFKLTRFIACGNEIS